MLCLRTKRMSISLSMILQLIYLHQTTLQFITNCQTHFNNDPNAELCDTCKSGFFLGESKTFCTPCTSGCAKCDRFGVCQSCIGGSYLDNGICISCSPQCLNCGAKTGCTLCMSGFWPGPNGTCTKCITNCQECLTPSTCEKCSGTFKYEMNKNTNRMECMLTTWTYAMYVVIGVILLVCVAFIVVCACSGKSISKWTGAPIDLHNGTERDRNTRAVIYKDHMRDIAQIVTSNGPGDDLGGISTRRRNSNTSVILTAERKVNTKQKLKLNEPLVLNAQPKDDKIKTYRFHGKDYEQLDEVISEEDG